MVSSSAPIVLPARAADDDPVEPPLDPAIERIRQRLKRLIVVSSATLLVGLVAVLAAVIYKIGPGKDKAGLAPMQGEVTIAGALPAGAHVSASALDGTILSLTFEAGGETRMVVIDLAGNRILRRIRFGTALPATP